MANPSCCRQTASLKHPESQSRVSCYTEQRFLDRNAPGGILLSPGTAAAGTLCQWQRNGKALSEGPVLIANRPGEYTATLSRRGDPLAVYTYEVRFPATEPPWRVIASPKDDSLLAVLPEKGAEGASSPMAYEMIHLDLSAGKARLLQETWGGRLVAYRGPSLCYEKDGNMQSISTKTGKITPLQTRPKKHSDEFLPLSDCFFHLDPYEAFAMYVDELEREHLLTLAYPGA